LKFTDNHNGTATIAGTPANGAAGTYPVTLIARNNAGTATQTFRLTVSRAPAIARLGTIRATVGARLHRVIHTRGYPTPVLTETGTLPTGLSFTDNQNGTAALTGTPAVGSCGRYWIAIAAANPWGTAIRRISILFKRHKGC
jgi:PKD repeat protein